MAVESISYTKIPIINFAKTIVYTCFSLGLYLLYQKCQLANALTSGNIALAQTAIERGGWWLYWVKSDDIRTLAQKNQIESIKLIGAQILFDHTAPSGGSSDAEEFIKARDSRKTNQKLSQILKTILPFDKHQKTKPLDFGLFTIRTFVYPAPELEPDRVFENYLEHVFSKHGETKEMFVKAMLDRFPDLKNDPEARSFFEENYLKHRRVT